MGSAGFGFHTLPLPRRRDSPDGLHLSYNGLTAFMHDASNHARNTTTFPTGSAYGAAQKSAQAAIIARRLSSMSPR